MTDKNSKLARQKLEHLLHTATNPVVIFDLDGTVFDVTYRTIEILKRFLSQKEIRTKFPEQCATVEKLRYQDFHYGLESTLNSVGVNRFSEHSAHFVNSAETFWFKHFFTDDLISADVPYPGAQECVRFFYQNGAHVVYLSGRDIPNMSKGTIESLEKYDFPHTGHRISICLKPAYGQDDLLFKKQSIENISKTGEVVTTFDNEPANVEMFISRFPKALHVHFDTLYAKKMDLNDAQLITVKSFKDLGF